jgi:uncharacterized surface protein with fasciclin (FAS1) repeats
VAFLSTAVPTDNDEQTTERGREMPPEGPSGQAAVVVGTLGGASLANGFVYVVDRVLLPPGLRLGRGSKP